jgi:hypothetical protein
MVFFVKGENTMAEKRRTSDLMHFQLSSIKKVQHVVIWILDILLQYCNMSEGCAYVNGDFVITLIHFKLLSNSMEQSLS